jgi:hypothetical protein
MAMTSLEAAMRPRFDITQIAITCHEMIRGYQLAVGEPAPSDPWPAAPARLRVIAVKGVERAMQHPSVAEHHAGWVTDMEHDGWRFGKRKSWAERTHPNMVPWADLPPDERVKDELFLLIVGRMAAELR